MALSELSAKLYTGGAIDPQDLPSLAALKIQKNTFDVEFGLAKLPVEPGLIVVRGARQDEMARALSSRSEISTV